MTTKQKLAVGTLVLGIGAAALYLIFGQRQEDEPPIRVHNGSMEIETVAGKGTFKGENGDSDVNEASYSHETNVKNPSPELYASVYPTTNCTSGDLTGRRTEIAVTYHINVPESDREFSFRRGRISGVFATKIRPVRNDVTETPYKLTYGAGVLGYISRVELRGFGQPVTCTFTANDRTQIAICPYGNCRY